MRKFFAMVVLSVFSFVTNPLLAAESSSSMGNMDKSSMMTMQQSDEMQKKMDKMQKDMIQMQTDMKNAKTPEAMRQVMNKQMKMLQECMDMMNSMHGQMMGSMTKQ